jgi:diadenosine tetraphosphatase ApaH/serine/threonine PP2A family protein phosphatase
MCRRLSGRTEENMMRLVLRTTFLMLLLAVSGQAASWERVPIPNAPQILDADIEGSTLWLSTHGFGLAGYSKGLWVFHVMADGGIRQDTYNYRVYVGPSGDKWIGRDGPQTVDRLDDAGTFANKSDDRWWYYSYPAELANSRCFSIVGARPGFMWFGMRDDAHNHLGTLELMVENSDTTSADDVWYHYDNAWTPDSTRFTDDDVRALDVDQAGRLWIGYHAAGVDVWDYRNPAVFADDSWVHYSVDDGLPSELVQAIHVDAHDRVWVGTLEGLAVFDPAGGTWNTIEGLPGSEALTIDEDARGHIWVGTDEGVAMVYPSGRTAETYGVADGLPSPYVQNVVVDRSDGTVWAVCVDEGSLATSLASFDSGMGPPPRTYYAYPNPWKEATADGPMSFYGVPDASEVAVFDLLGEEVRRLPSTEPYVWDTLDAQGNKVASGVYVVRIDPPDDPVSLLKVAVIR